MKVHDSLRCYVTFLDVSKNMTYEANDMPVTKHFGPVNLKCSNTGRKLGCIPSVI